MRGVPLLDATGTQLFSELNESFKAQGTTVLFSGLQPKVKHLMERSGLMETVGEENFFWSVEQSIMAIEKEQLAS